MTVNQKLLHALQRALQEMPMHSHLCDMRVGEGLDHCTCWVKEAQQAVKEAAPPHSHLYESNCPVCHPEGPPPAPKYEL